MMRGALAVLTIGAFFAAYFAGCKKDEQIAGPGGSPSDVVFPASSVSYHIHVEKLFFQTCALDACHGDGAPSGNVKLTTYENTMLGAGSPPVRIVQPGRPDNSELLFRIDGRVPTQMPLGRNRLNDNQINGIRKWIEEGARNN